MTDNTIDPQYIALVKQLGVLFKIWIDKETKTRTVHLAFYHWQNVVYGAPLQGEALKLLCATEDTRAMCEWADAQSGGQATLLQALCAAELYGYKKPYEGPSIPRDVLANFQVIKHQIIKGGTA